jgi:hypothetical protein
VDSTSIPGETEIFPLCGTQEEGSMENTGPLRGSPVVGELAKVAQVLRQTETKKSFRQDRKSALEQAGVDLNAIPSSVMDTLGGMSDDELATVIRFNDALVDAGFAVEGPSEGPGKVCFF